MDLYEATNVLLSKIKTLDPENASRIMGCILLQGLSDSDLLRLAFGPDTLLQNLIITAKTQLGLLTNSLSSSSSSSTPSSPSPLNPISRPSNCNNPFSQSSPRDAGGGGGSFADFGKNQSPPARAVSGLLNNGITNVINRCISPKASPFLSYDNIRAGSALVPPFSENGGRGSDSSNANGDFFDECRLDEYLSFLDDSSSTKDEFTDLSSQFSGNLGDNGDTLLHRRRFSESDASFGTEDESFGLGYRPCMYFAKGYCKNGDNCKFVHGGFDGDNVVEVNVGGGCGATRGSPREMGGFFLQQQEEMMRMKAVQLKQQLAYNKYMDFLLQRRNNPQRFGAAAIMGDEFHKFCQFQPERNDLLAMGNAEKANSAARQIYLTFPADSTFKDEDVSNYFSTFGPVQDVRIPYQQKRMFGFVTFVHPETVKIILARGNPHFICDSRVLVKPYKEKGKVANERQLHVQQQLLERGNFSPGSSPSGLDPRELYDVHLGTRLLYSNQEMMLRRKLEEQAELQQAIELQGRRLINLQLPDIRGDYINRHQRSLSVGAPISLPTHTAVKQNVFLTSDGKNQEVQGNRDDLAAAHASAFTAAEKNLQQEVNVLCSQKNDTVNGKEGAFISETCGVRDGLKSNAEHALLPDNLFASPTKSSENQQPAFSSDSAEVKETTEFSVISSSDNESSVPITSTGNGPS